MAKRSSKKAPKDVNALAAHITEVATGEPAPDPDDELEGTSPAQISNYDKKLDKLREQAQETGDLGPVLAFKKAQREKVRA